MGLLDNLNPEQLAAATSDNPHILCVAGPGTGKTRTLTHRVAHRVQDGGTHPSNILCLTFTNKAANEMKERIGALINPRDARRITVGTFHSVCFKILRAWGNRLGYVDEHITVYDEIDRSDILKAVCRDMKKKVSQAALDAATVDLGCRAMPESELNAEIKIIFSEYRSRLRESNAVDFTTILTETNRLFASCPDVLAHYNQLWPEIYIDEYQDTDRMQYNLHRLIEPAHIFAIGDPDQAIYGFRGADQSIILQFETDYPGALIVKLSANYRSTAQIVDAANTLIKHNINRIDNPIVAEREGEPVCVVESDNAGEQAFKVMAQIKGGDAAALNETAILYRKNASARAVADMLEAKEIPYQILTRENDFYGREEVRKMLALMRLVNNPADSYSLGQVINWPVWRIPKDTWRGLKIESLKAEKSILETLLEIPALEMTGATPPPKEFAQIILALHEYAADVLASDVAALIAARLDVANFFISHDLTSRAQNVHEFIGRVCEWCAAAPPGERALADYLVWFAIRTAQDSLKKKENSVKLLTIHAAKGLEWDRVFIVDATERDYHLHKPDTDTEEERRIFYVAATRARNELIISWPKMSEGFGSKLIMNQPARFIQEAGSSA